MKRDKAAKSTKKLKVSRESVRSLDNESLRKAGGGWNTGAGCGGGGSGSENCWTNCCSVGTNHNQALLRI